MSLEDQDAKHENCETSGSYKEVKYKALSCDLPCTGTEPVTKSMATYEPTGGMSTELEYKVANQSSPEPVVIVSYDVDLKILKLQLPSSMSVEGALNQLQSKWSVQYGEGVLSKVEISEKLMSTSSNGTELKTNIPQQSSFICMQVFDLEYGNKHFSIRSPIHGFVADFIVDMMEVFYLMVK